MMSKVTCDVDLSENPLMAPLKGRAANRQYKVISLMALYEMAFNK
jgi:hypothetical protein